MPANGTALSPSKSGGIAPEKSSTVSADAKQLQQYIDAYGSATFSKIQVPKMPALTGSEKQVKWAEDIRRKFLVDYRSNLASEMKDLAGLLKSSDKSVAEKLSVAREFRALTARNMGRLKSESSSRFWIDKIGNRYPQREMSDFVAGLK